MAFLPPPLRFPWVDWLEWCEAQSAVQLLADLCAFNAEKSRQQTFAEFYERPNGSSIDVSAHSLTVEPTHIAEAHPSSAIPVSANTCTAQYHKHCTALDRIFQRWRHRGRLPLVIDATATLLSPLLRDLLVGYESADAATASLSLHKQASVIVGGEGFTPADRLVQRTVLCSCIARLVSGLSDSSQKGSKATSIWTASRKRGLDRLLVDIRHETTHGDLPDWHIAVSGGRLLLQWLTSHYWWPQAVRIHQLMGIPLYASVYTPAYDAVKSVEQFERQVLHVLQHRDTHESASAILSSIQTRLISVGKDAEAATIRDAVNEIPSIRSLVELCMEIARRDVDNQTPKKKAIHPVLIAIANEAAAQLQGRVKQRCHNPPPQQLTLALSWLAHGFVAPILELLSCNASDTNAAMAAAVFLWLAVTCGGLCTRLYYFCFAMAAKHTARRRSDNGVSHLLMMLTSSEFHTKFASDAVRIPPATLHELMLACSAMNVAKAATLPVVCQGFTLPVSGGKRKRNQPNTQQHQHTDDLGVVTALLELLLLTSQRMPDTPLHQRMQAVFGIPHFPADARKNNNNAAVSKPSALSLDDFESLLFMPQTSHVAPSVAASAVSTKVTSTTGWELW